MPTSQQGFSITSLKSFKSTNNQIGSHIISFLIHEDKRVERLWATAKPLLWLQVTGVDLEVAFGYGVAARGDISAVSSCNSGLH